MKEKMNFLNNAITNLSKHHTEVHDAIKYAEHG